MGVKIPASFEDSTGTIARLTGEIELLIPATPTEVLTADNPASTASFQAGGGDGAAVQAVYTGNAVSIGNATNASLTWDTLSSGTALLDITTPDAPTFLTDGTYAVSVEFNGPALTASGYAAGNLQSDTFTFAGAYTEQPSQGAWGASGVIVAAAGDGVFATVTNGDGAMSQDFNIATAVVVKL